ncbi:glyoxalase [Hahella sp. CCB-MM4]|uniref:VOC family protein n=1 Tax=Hahella sp. (strain CCB-MM4) TaxID=1926491 RepID=UPI000B9B0F71|nr:VOC family protein [Hahella sp. CCB-MM4]OZG72376.1 glyoxalase [Hahella sp. CCB-MM4]
MHKSRLAAMVIDCDVEDIETANRFWGQALGFDPKPSDESWADRYTHLNVPDDQPHVLIQKVNHPSRVHLDIETDNIEAEVNRLQSLGATIVERFPRWVVMEAPTGHRFCVVNPQRPDFGESPEVNVWGD